MKKFFQNLKISQKLRIIVYVALVGMLLIGVISINLMGRLNEQTTDISTSWLPSVDTAREMNTTISKIRLHELAYLTAVSSESKNLNLEDLEQEKKEMTALLEKYGSLIDEEEKTF